MFGANSGSSSGQTSKGLAAARAHQTKHQPWVEKYRPHGVDDIAHQDEVVKTLKNAIQTGTLPHLLFYGPPGTGKTSTILAVARSLFGPEYRSRILELNASDERGIKVVREKVKQFAQFTVTGLEKVQGYPCPPFKIVILDEADTMTTEAQAALRRTMETYSKITRFCLVCNYVTRIIEPLASRCAKFRFRPLSKEVMQSRLLTIAKDEDAHVSEEMMSAILTIADGDMRKAVTTLQSAHQFYGKGEVITPDAIREMSGGVPDAVVEGLWTAVRSQAFDNLRASCTEVELAGYPTMAVLQRLFDLMVNDEQVRVVRVFSHPPTHLSIPSTHLPTLPIHSPTTTHPPTYSFIYTGQGRQEGRGGARHCPGREDDHRRGQRELAVAGRGSPDDAGVGRGGGCLCRRGRQWDGGGHAHGALGKEGGWVCGWTEE